MLLPSALNQVFVSIPMLWSLPVVLEPPSGRWLEEVTVFVVSALMDVSVGEHSRSLTAVGWPVAFVSSGRHGW